MLLIRLRSQKAMKYFHSLCSINLPLAETLLMGLKGQGVYEGKKLLLVHADTIRATLNAKESGWTVNYVKMSPLGETSAVCFIIFHETKLQVNINSCIG